MKFCHFRTVGFLISLCAGCLFLFSCASTTKTAGAEISPVYITNSKKFFLLPPERIERNIDSLQLIVGSFGSSEFAMQVYLQADAAGFSLFLLNDFGTNMGTLSYDGMRVRFDSSLFPKGLKAEYIAADLQFAYYRPEAISDALSEIGLRFDVLVDSDGTEVRRIMDKEKCIEEIRRGAGTTVITNFLRDYRYHLQEAEE